MQNKKFYRGTEKRIPVDNMKKAELRFELDNLRDEYDRMKLKEDVIKMIDRMPTTTELYEIREFVENIYKKSVAKNWGSLFGARDNIVDMANNLAELWKTDELQYFSHFMYGKLLGSDAEETAEGLYAMTDAMRREFLESKCAGSL